MKRAIAFFAAILLLLPSLLLYGCDLIGGIGGTDDNVHTDSFEPITGRFILHHSPDDRIDCSDTYFDIDGSAGAFTLKYYENGELKREGEMNRIVTRDDKTGYLTDNLHFNIRCGSAYEHIGAYTESLDPINQFRIIDEYKGGREEIKYYYSELPFVLGTYVREGEDYAPETLNKNATDHTLPTLASYTSELSGKYQLDAEHYFYFISPKAYVSKDGPYMSSYFQYYSPELDKPLEGFAFGVTYETGYTPPHITFTLSREPSHYDSLEDTENVLTFGYMTFTEEDRMVEHYGSIDFSGGELKSFTFEHLSRSWTEEEWDKFMSDSDYKMPDAIIYEYVGGTYARAE